MGTEKVKPIPTHPITMPKTTPRSHQPQALDHILNFEENSPVNQLEENEFKTIIRWFLFH